MIKHQSRPSLHTFVGRSFTDLNAVAVRTRLIEHVRLERCTFANTGLSMSLDVKERVVVRDAELRACQVRRCYIGHPVLDEILIDDLVTHQPLFVEGAAFRHVTLRGRIGSLVIRPELWDPRAPSRAQRAVDDANRAFYRGVDWALDIREATTDSLELLGVPPELVLRDRERHAVVRRSEAVRGRWRGVDLTGTWFDITLDRLAKSTADTGILVAPDGDRRAVFVNALARLREAGVAEAE